MTIENQTLVDADRRAVIKAFGVASETNGVWVDASALKNIDTTYVITTAAQDEGDYNGAGNNGSFVGGTGHSGTDVLTMSDGSTITVDAVSGGVVTQFTVTTSSTSGFTSLSTLTQSSSDGSGIVFTLTTGTANEIQSARITLTKLYFSVAGGGDLLVKWNATTNATALALSGNGVWNFEHMGSVISNTNAAGANGDILITTDSSVTGYTLIGEFHKLNLGFSDPTLA
jgi:hypothetical protein